MEQLTIDHNNGHKTVYNLYPVQGNLPIAYDEKTPAKVVEVLERCRKEHKRIKLHYGDIATGKDWNEENDVTGYVGLSRGTEARYPILVHNSRSSGGGSILTACIVKIKDTTKSGNVLYKAANYQQSNIIIVPSDLPEFTHNLEIDGKVWSRHKSIKSAQKLQRLLS